MENIFIHNQEQMRNREEARIKMNEWLKCIIKADVNNRDILLKDAAKLLLVNSRMDTDLNARVNVILNFVNTIHQVMSEQQ